MLYQEAVRAGGELELVTLGPLTNVAIALKRHPDLAGLIKKITMMAGTAGQGNTNVYAEFNVWVDPHACDIVFRSGIPIAMCGLDGNDSCRLDTGEMAQVFDRPAASPRSSAMWRISSISATPSSGICLAPPSTTW